MAAITPDCVIYQDEPFYIFAVNGVGLPSPEQFGLSPDRAAMRPGCFRGYYCDYTVQDEQLVLSHLVIRTQAKVYPPVQGVHAIIEESHPLDEDAPRPELLRGMSLGRQLS